VGRIEQLGHVIRLGVSVCSSRAKSSLQLDTSEDARRVGVCVVPADAAAQTPFGTKALDVGGLAILALFLSLVWGTDELRRWARRSHEASGPSYQPQENMNRWIGKIQAVGES